MEICTEVQIAIEKTIVGEQYQQRPIINCKTIEAKEEIMIRNWKSGYSYRRLCYHFHLCEKYLTQINFKKEMFFLAHGFSLWSDGAMVRQKPHVRRTWWRKATYLIASRKHKDRERAREGGGRRQNIVPNSEMSMTNLFQLRPVSYFHHLLILPSNYDSINIMIDLVKFVS